MLTPDNILTQKVMTYQNMPCHPSSTSLMSLTNQHCQPSSSTSKPLEQHRFSSGDSHHDLLHDTFITTIAEQHLEDTKHEATMNHQELDKLTSFMSFENAPNNLHLATPLVMCN